MDILKKIASILILIFTTSLFSLTEDNIYDNLIKKYSNINTFYAEFKQFNYWADIEESLLSYGKIYYNKQKMLLEYNKPKLQKVLVDSSSVLVWYVNQNQALLTKNNMQISKPINIITQYWNKSKKKITQDKKKISVELLSEQQTIKVTLQDYLIVKLKIINSDGNIVEYDFDNIKINPTFRKDLLEIKLPKEVKIFKN